MINKADSRPKKVLVLTSTFPRWEGDSGPSFVFELCRRLSAEFEVHVLAPHAHGAKNREKIGAIEVNRFRYFFSRWELLAYQGGIMANLKRHPGLYLLVPFFLLFQFFAVLRIVKRERVDVIHAHWLIPQGLIAAGCSLVTGSRFPPLLCTCHGTDLLGLPGQFFTALKRWVLKRSNAVTVVSKTLEQHVLMLGATPENVSVIPMGTDALTLFTPPAPAREKATEILFVGRLVASKSVNSLIEAMPAVLLEFPDATLLIAGDGPETASLRELCRSLGIAGKVDFLGALANQALPDIYRRAAVFVSPSLSEGFGLTIAEALACECAVIASDLPAIRELIIDGETGLIVPPGDAAAIARSVVRLLADPAARRKLSQAGRTAILGRFDWQVVASGYAGRLHTLGVQSSHE